MDKGQSLDTQPAVTPVRDHCNVQKSAQEELLELGTPSMQEFLNDNEKGLYDHCRGDKGEPLNVESRADPTKSVENIDHLLREDILSPTREVQRATKIAEEAKLKDSTTSEVQQSSSSIVMPQVFMPYRAFNYQQSNTANPMALRYYPGIGYVQSSRLSRPGTLMTASYPSSRGNVSFSIGEGRTNALGHRPFTQHEFAGTNYQPMSFSIGNAGETMTTVASLSNKSGISLTNKNNTVASDNFQHQPSGNLNLLSDVSVAVGSRLEVGCRCLKSQCLKLYCDCFASGNVCLSSCSCSKCLNTKEESSQYGRRSAAISSILKRKPDAFQRKRKNANQGCACKKSNCLKKYCTCFNNETLCGQLCLCVDCHNTRDVKRQRMTEEQASELAETLKFDYEDGAIINI